MRRPNLLFGEDRAGIGVWLLVEVAGREVSEFALNLLVVDNDAGIWYS